MPSDYTEIFGLELQATGENLNSWGGPNGLNRAFRLVDDAASVETIALTGNLTLSNTLSAPNQARKGSLIFTDGGLSAIPVVTIPAVKRLRYVENQGATYAITFTAGGATASLAAGRKGFLLCTGTDVFVFDPIQAVGPFVSSAQDAADRAQLWATFLNTAVAGGEYSAKEHAIGTSVPAGSAKSWATKTGSAVAASEFSAKEYAQGSTATGGTAKQWSTSVAIVAGGFKGARGYAEDAASSAGTANDSAEAASSSEDAAAGFATVSGNEADRAQGYADALNLPAISIADAGKALVINDAGTGYDKRLTGATLARSSRTSNTVISKLDSSSIIDITSGTFTQTFSSPSALGNGWFAYIRNSGTGDITIPASDGRTNWIMYPNETRLFHSDGTTLRSVVVVPFSKTFTASGTFIKPPGYSNFEALVWSAGESGSKSGSAAAARGGASGGCFPFKLPESSLALSEVITIGAGGAAVTGSASGNAGGASSIGAVAVISGASNGAGGGIAVGNDGASAAVGFASAPNSSFSNSTIWGGFNASSDASSNGQSSQYGGGCGGGINGSGVIRTPGLSVFAGNGGAASDAGNGADGVAPAGGGGATRTGASSGAGARGEIRIWGVA